jgi:effector-binding domain-containing protein
MSEPFEVIEKVLPPMLIAGIRTKGKYSDCGPLFGKLCRQARSATGGSPMMLHYDMEYRETDADFEACIPLKTRRELPGASVRELPGGRCISLLHKGPYEQLGGSYAKILGYARDKGYRVTSPCREIYIKGPGMIFRGNPQKYLTEIQMVIEPA